MRKRPIRSALGGLLCGVGLAACASVAAAGSYRGILHLKGNAPFVKAILEDDSGKQWLLDGVNHETALSLQNRHVEINGTPSEEASPPAQARLKAESIRGLPTGK